MCPRPHPGYDDVSPPTLWEASLSCCIAVATGTSIVAALALLGVLATAYLGGIPLTETLP